MSIFNKKKTETTEQQRTTRQTLDPQAQAGLNLLQTTAAGLADAPLVAPLSPGTLGAIEGVGEGIGEIDPIALSALQEGATAEFVPGGRGVLDRLFDVIGERAATQVSDVFTAGGRTGSPASAKAIASGVSEALAGPAFGFEQSELARESAADARRISSALGLQQITSAAQGAQFQAQLEKLSAEGRIDEQTRRELEEPFKRLGLITGPITAAAGLAPRTTEEVGTGRATGTETGFSLDII